MLRGYKEVQDEMDPLYGGIVQFYTANLIEDQSDVYDNFVIASASLEWLANTVSTTNAALSGTLTLAYVTNTSYPELFQGSSVNADLVVLPSPQSLIDNATKNRIAQASAWVGVRSYIEPPVCIPRINDSAPIEDIQLQSRLNLRIRDSDKDSVMSGGFSTGAETLPDVPGITVYGNPLGETPLVVEDFVGPDANIVSTELFNVALQYSPTGYELSGSVLLVGDIEIEPDDENPTFFITAVFYNANTAVEARSCASQAVDFSSANAAANIQIAFNCFVEVDEDITSVRLLIWSTASNGFVAEYPVSIRSFNTKIVCQNASTYAQVNRVVLILCAESLIPDNEFLISGTVNAAMVPNPAQIANIETNDYPNTQLASAENAFFSDPNLQYVSPIAHEDHFVKAARRIEEACEMMPSETIGRAFGFGDLVSAVNQFTPGVMKALTGVMGPKLVEPTAADVMLVSGFKRGATAQQAKDELQRLTMTTPAELVGEIIEADKKPEANAKSRIIEVKNVKQVPDNWKKEKSNRSASSYDSVSQDLRRLRGPTVEPQGVVFLDGVIPRAPQCAMDQTMVFNDGGVAAPPPFDTKNGNFTTTPITITPVGLPSGRGFASSQRDTSYGDLFNRVRPSVTLTATDKVVGHEGVTVCTITNTGRCDIGKFTLSCSNNDTNKEYDIVKQLAPGASCVHGVPLLVGSTVALSIEGVVLATAKPVVWLYPRIHDGAPARFRAKGNKVKPRKPTTKRSDIQQQGFSITPVVAGTAYKPSSSRATSRVSSHDSCAETITLTVTGFKRLVYVVSDVEPVWLPAVVDVSKPPTLTMLPVGSATTCCLASSKKKHGTANFVGPDGVTRVSITGPAVGHAFSFGDLVDTVGSLASTALKVAPLLAAETPPQQKQQQQPQRAMLGVDDVVRLYQAMQQPGLGVPVVASKPRMTRTEPSAVTSQAASGQVASGRVASGKAASGRVGKARGTAASGSVPRLSAQERAIVSKLLTSDNRLTILPVGSFAGNKQCMSKKMTKNNVAFAPPVVQCASSTDRRLDNNPDFPVVPLKRGTLGSTTAMVCVTKRELATLGEGVVNTQFDYGMWSRFMSAVVSEEIGTDDVAYSPYALFAPVDNAIKDGITAVPMCVTGALCPVVYVNPGDEGQSVEELEGHQASTGVTIHMAVRGNWSFLLRRGHGVIHQRETGFSIFGLNYRPGSKIAFQLSCDMTLLPVVMIDGICYVIEGDSPTGHSADLAIYATMKRTFDNVILLSGEINDQGLYEIMEADIKQNVCVEGVDLYTPGRVMVGKKAHGLETGMPLSMFEHWLDEILPTLPSFSNTGHLQVRTLTSLAVNCRLKGVTEVLNVVHANQNRFNKINSFVKLFSSYWNRVEIAQLSPESILLIARYVSGIHVDFREARLSLIPA